MSNDRPRYLAREGAQSVTGVPRAPERPALAPEFTDGTLYDLAQLATVSQVAPDRRIGSLAELAGQRFLILAVGQFYSRRTDSIGNRLLIRRILAGDQLGPEQMYTSFSSPVKRTISALIGEDGVMERHLDPPIIGTIERQGETYVLK